MYPKNAASPERIAVGAIYQISDGAIQTAGASVRVMAQGGAAGAGGGTLACDSTSGIWYYTPTQAETNYTSFMVMVYKASCTSACMTVVTTATSVPGTVDVGAISGDSAAADNLELDYDGTGYAKANSTIGTCTTNTDMRGTDNAATAAKLLDYVQLLARKDTAITADNAAALAEINADEGTGAGDYNNTSDAQEAQRDTMGEPVGEVSIVDDLTNWFLSINDLNQAEAQVAAAAALTAWGKTGFSLTADQSAVTIGTVNIVTNAVVTDAASRAASKADVSALALEETAQTILADTNELQTNQGNWLTATGFAQAGDPMTLTIAERTTLAGAILDLASAIDGKTLREALRYIAAAVAGKASGAGTGTEIFVGLDGTTSRLTSTVDNDGNRTAVSYDP